MNNSVYNISLDLHAIGSQLTLNAKAYDTARTIRCTITENGKPYTISEGCYAAFTAKKPDGNVLFNATTIDDAINYEFTVNTVNAPGEVECEIRLYDGNGKLITSPRFTILVDDTVYHDGDVVESSSEFTALTDLMSSVIRVLGEVPSPVLYGMGQSLTDEQKAQARENIGAAAIGDAGGIPIAYGAGTATTDTYEATGSDLPYVKTGSGGSHEGKGKQIIFVPFANNVTEHPKLILNDGSAIEIRKRAEKNHSTSEQRPDATDTVPIGALMAGVPYTMTFCGAFWLVDSMIGSTGGKEDKPTVLTWDEQQYPELIDFLRSITEAGKYEFRRNIDDAYQYQYELTVSDNGEEREYYGFLRYFVCDEPVLGYRVYIGEPGTERFYEHPNLSITTRQDLENALGDIETAINAIRGVTE